MYYFFSLTDTTNIEFLTFFTTMIEGSVALMVSTDEKYPRTDRVGSKGRLTTSNSILFFHNELEKVYYVGLYASEMATFTLGVLIKREQTASNESAHDTQITMRENVGQLYTLQVTEKVDFLIHIKTSIPKNYTV